MARATLFGRSPLGGFLRYHEWLWEHLPRSGQALLADTKYGHLINSITKLQRNRQQYTGTFFFRNRPLIELICRLANQRAVDSSVRIAVLGCSIGAEVYSIMYAIRSKDPALEIEMNAADISEQVLRIAREGNYPLGFSDVVQQPICERLEAEEISAMFDSEQAQAKVKPWIREGIVWRVLDARDPNIVDKLGRQDLVLANHFLCHMEPVEAERCLRNIAQLVDCGGYLVVSGIDLDIRTKVANELGWKPVNEMIEEIHNGDWSLRLSWPLKYWGLEPLSKERSDWRIRYSTVFQLGESPSGTCEIK